MTIGIIEDDLLVNQALDIALQNAGYHTICVHTKKEALSLLGKTEGLLFVDIGLPDGDGITLYQELRKKRDIPAIFLTARDEEQDMLAAFDMGADDYVVKPFSMKVPIRKESTRYWNRSRRRADAFLPGYSAVSRQKTSLLKGTGDRPDREGVSAVGVSDEESGASADERKYPGADLGVWMASLWWIIGSVSQLTGSEKR